MGHIERPALVVVTGVPQVDHGNAWRYGQCAGLLRRGHACADLLADERQGIAQVFEASVDAANTVFSVGSGGAELIECTPKNYQRAVCADPMLSRRTGRRRVLGRASALTMRYAQSMPSHAQTGHRRDVGRSSVWWLGMPSQRPVMPRLGVASSALKR